ncbi:DUF6970 domain-containing protein [Hymenobacter cellulosilyticus]|uniref:DUF6970 domain-containing protein n=1 Tax=Hymenobacter cellulosilyticus TaxID=2932248 RepID=A0A8T9Q629_9BACT|nr:hypothetical protein [Hymenobacter cellulosilyticus]UOQ72565.1 hypothetical protein MUN79_00740 [Hymenobacter cellulosilyticus]
MVQCQDDTAEPAPAACDVASAQPLIDKLLQNPKANPAGEVKRYTVHGKIVFLVDSHYPDAYANYYDEQLKPLCSEGTGISGRYQNSCQWEKQDLINECLVWRDPR